jgi:hypothetical protein
MNTHSHHPARSLAYPVGLLGAVDAIPAGCQRTQWAIQFAERLSELRFDEDFETFRADGEEMWADVGMFDPVITAEMEFEAWRAGDPIERAGSTPQ